jgi:hypothetical protein
VNLRIQELGLATFRLFQRERKRELRSVFHPFQPDTVQTSIHMALQNTRTDISH